MHVCVCVCRTLPEMMFCFEDVDARPLCVLSIVRHTFFERESNAMSEQFRTGEGKLFHGLAQKKSVHSEHQANYSKLTKRAWKLGNFLVLLCFDFPLSL